MEPIEPLSMLLRIRNTVDRDIATIIGRPAHTGHIAEFIASRIFGIELHPGASHKGSDGYFKGGHLDGQSVNIKYASRQAGLLDLPASYDPNDHAQWYLILAGPKTAPVGLKGTTAPFNVDAVYLFRSYDLLASLASKPVKIGIATSVRKVLWQAAMIFPGQMDKTPVLTEGQKRQLALFSPSRDALIAPD